MTYLPEFVTQPHSTSSSIRKTKKTLGYVYASPPHKKKVIYSHELRGINLALILPEILMKVVSIFY